MPHNPPSAERPAFQRRQLEFAAHIRDPHRRPRPADVAPRRMAVYAELFYNNVEGLLADGFPVLRGITPDARWYALVRDFYARHRCRTPLFLELGREFLDYLAHERQAPTEDPPFLWELAHYEWVELALAVSDADRIRDLAVVADADLLAGHPVLSPLAWNLRYRFPVHRIGPGFQPAEAGAEPTCLLVYRDGDDEVHFLETNAVTHALLALLAEEPRLNGRQALLRIAARLRHPRLEAVVEFGAGLLGDLRRRGIVLGATG